MNCQPGDLAISVNTEQPANEGRIVRVLRRHENTPEWNYGDRAAWWCESDEPIVWYFRRRGEYRFGHEGPIPDDALRPIPPSASATTATRTAGPEA